MFIRARLQATLSVTLYLLQLWEFTLANSCSSRESEGLFTQRDMLLMWSPGSARSF